MKKTKTAPVQDKEAAEKRFQRLIDDFKTTYFGGTLYFLNNALKTK
jgi:hypothetical protein